MSKPRKEYISALSYDLLTPLYDLVIRLTMPESRFKRRLIVQSDIREGYRVLDLGCGTGTRTLLIKKTHPDTEVFGLDGDQKILNIAKTKADQAEMELTFNEAMADELPYPDNSFDRVVSRLVFHHLRREVKARALQEIFRVLRPGGELNVADWGKPQNLLMRVSSLPLRMFDGLETTRDNVKGRLPQMFRNARFEEVQERTQFMTMFGTLSLYEARKPQ